MANTDPLTDEEKAALQQMFSSAATGDLTYTLETKDKEAVQQFVLKSRSYWDLRHYVNCGMALDDTYDKFAAHFPRANFAPAEDLETNIWAKIQTVIVGVQQSCHAFNNNTMGNFLTVTTGIIGLCDDFARWVGGKGLLGDIMAQLSNPSTPAAMFDLQKKKAAYICKLLAGRSGTQAEACGKLQTALVGFYNETKETHHPRVDYLCAQFLDVFPPSDNSGPYEPSSSNPTDFTFQLDKNQDPIPRTSKGKKMDTYGNILQGELKEIIKEVTELTAKAKAEAKEWENDAIIAGTAATYVWIWPFGTISASAVMSVYAERAKIAKERYKAIMKDIAEKNAQQFNISTCIELVTELKSIFENVDERMDAAIQALDAMKTHFSVQKTNLDRLGQVLTELEGADDDMLKILGAEQLVDAEKSWATLKELALNYLQFTDVKYEMI